MATGTVKWFDPEKGYGFIARDGGDGDVFVHISEAPGGNLNEGDRVEFSLGFGPKGEKAEQVRVTEPNPNPRPRRPRGNGNSFGGQRYGRGERAPRRAYDGYDR